MRSVARGVADAFILGALLLAAAKPLRAQDQSTRPAFSLATIHIFTTRESPALTLTHRPVDHLDFRVYDAFGFFGKLRDAHELGSDDPVVPQEQTWLERIAVWRAPSCDRSSGGSSRPSIASTRLATPPASWCRARSSRRRCW